MALQSTARVAHTDQDHKGRDYPRGNQGEETKQQYAQTNQQLEGGGNVKLNSCSLDGRRQIAAREAATSLDLNGSSTARVDAAPGGREKKNVKQRHDGGGGRYII